MRTKTYPAGWLIVGALLAGVAQAQTIKFTKLWDIPTGLRDYVTTGTTERGIAVNPVTGHVIMVSRAGGLNVVILDPVTGEELGRMDTTDVLGGTFALSTIAVAEDGAIYGANLVLSASEAAPVNVYRWADESAVPTLAYSGSPSDGMRIGDSLGLRGKGTDTQIALGTASATTGVRFAILTTTDGENFNATAFSPAGVGAGGLQKGITFGPGDTIIGKINGQNGKYIRFNLADGSSSVIRDVVIDNAISPVDYEPANKLLAGMKYTTHELLVYDVSDFVSPSQLAKFPFPAPATANGNGVGAVDFGKGMLVAIDTQNGVLAYKVELDTTPVAPTITSQPVGVTALEGATVSFSVGAVGTKPLNYQWKLNGTAIQGATAAVYTITGVQPSAAGDYTVEVGNVVGSVTSDPATLGVRPLVKSGRLVKLWSKGLGELQFLANDNAHRGLAYHPVNGNVLVISRTVGDTNVYVLNGQTGELKHRLRSTDESDMNLIYGGYFALNMIGVADDGAVYACNLSTSGNDLIIYRWADDNPDTIPMVAYGPANPELVRCGDAIDVRGSGTDTQILIPSRNGKNVAVFTTTDGAMFSHTVITVPDATDGNFGISVAFGAGNTFWGKAPGASLRHVEFDLAAGTGATLHNYAATNFPGSMAPIAVLPAENQLAAVSLDTPDNLQLYDIADLASLPVLVHQELFPSDNANANGTGAVDFGGGRVYALDSNNGIVAFEVKKSPPKQPTLANPKLVAGGKLEITVLGQAGVTYVVEASMDLQSWAEVLTQASAGESTTVQVDATGAARRFFRVKIK
jgi:hypothetical protein